MILYDAHTHQTSNLKNRNSILNIIVCSNIFLELSEYFYYSAGIHPWSIKKPKQQIESLKHILKHSNVLAIGECGLDYCIDTDKELQKEIFEIQVHLSENIKKPIIIHAVRSYSDILEILGKKKMTQNILFHAYQSSWPMAQALLKFNSYFSFGQQILQASKKQIETLENLPSYRILIESDEHPELLEDIYKQIAKVRKVDLNTLISIQKDNFENFYNLSI